MYQVIDKKLDLFMGEAGTFLAAGAMRTMVAHESRRPVWDFEVIIPKDAPDLIFVPVVEKPW